MVTGKIAKRSVDAVERSVRDTFLWDDELRGFGLKTTPGGAKSYVYQYRLGGREAKTRRYTIGKHGSPWTPASARTEAERLARLVGQGIDPASADEQRRRQAVDLAFAPYAENFIDRYLSVEWPGAHGMAAGILRSHVVPILRDKPLTLINRSDIVQVIDRLSPTPGLRRNTYAVLRKLFRWAISRGDIVGSPVDGMEPPPAPGSRDRILSDGELALVWRGIETLGVPFDAFFRLLILTGQRRQEVAGLRWEELSEDNKLWTIPSDRAKNGRVHLVPLNGGAVATLAAVARGDWPRRGLVLSTTGETPISGYSRAKNRLDAAIVEVCHEMSRKAVDGANLCPMAPWRVHDLRRTVATGFQRLGVRFEVTESVLNHVSGSKSGIAGVYQRHDWAEEKAVALAAWGAHVAALVHPQDGGNA